MTDESRERYYVAGGYDRNIAARFFRVLGAGWDRDRDGGIENRSVAYGGVGNTWRDDEHMKFKTDSAITYTRRIDDIPDPERDETFSEARLAPDYTHKFNATMMFDSDFVFFVNVSEASDYRFNTQNAVTTNLTSVLDLRFGLQQIYQNLPALESIDLFDLDPSAGGLGIGSAIVRKEKLDSILRLSLVVTF